MDSSASIEHDVLVMFTLVCFFVAALNSQVTREQYPTIAQFLRWARVPLLIAAWAISAAAFVKFWQLCTWMQNSIWPADKAEGDRTFGQFLPLLLMMLAGLAFIEAFPDHLEDALFDILRPFWNMLLSTIIGRSSRRWSKEEPFILPCSESQQYLPVKGAVSS